MFAARRFVLVLLVVACSSPLLAGVVGSPLTMSANFNPGTVTVGGTATTTLTVTITNPNGFSVSGISFSDTYPAGLVPDQVGAYTCSAGSAVFSGTGWALSNVTLGAGASCSVPVLMHATITGPIINTTSLVTGIGVPPGGPTLAILNATATPTLSEWTLIALAVTLAVVAAFRIKG